MKKAILIFILFAAWLLALNHGLNKHAMHECLTWKRQTETIRGFYLTPAQEKQCQALGLDPLTWEKYHSPEFGLTR